MSEVGSALLAGAIAGFGLAVAVGPISLLILETGLRRGWAAGAAAGLGAATVDGAYALVAVFAGAAVAGLIEPIAGPIRLVSGLLLGAIAIRSLLALRDARRETGAAVAGTKPPVRDVGPSLRRTWLTIVGLTAVNPLTVIYFTALVLGMPSLGRSTEARIAFALAIAVASGIWQLTLATIGAVLHRRLPPAARTLTSLVGNAIVLVLALAIVRGALG